MIAIRPFVFPSLVAATLLGGIAVVRTADAPVEDEGVVVDIGPSLAPADDMAALVRRFYATRDASIAPIVQDWLTARHEGVIDPDALDHAMRLSRRAQIEACTSIDPHGGDVDLSIEQSANGRTMDAHGTNPDVVECVETIASSIEIANGSTYIALAYHSGVLLDAGTFVMIDHSEEPVACRNAAIYQMCESSLGSPCPYLEARVAMYFIERNDACSLLEDDDRAAVNEWAASDISLTDAFHGHHGHRRHYTERLDAEHLRAWVVRELGDKIATCLDYSEATSLAAHLSIDADGVSVSVGAVRGPEARCVETLLANVVFPEGDASVDFGLVYRPRAVF